MRLINQVVKCAAAFEELIFKSLLKKKMYAFLKNHSCQFTHVAQPFVLTRNSVRMNYKTITDVKDLEEVCNVIVQAVKLQ
jgi:SET domain-containing protein